VPANNSGVTMRILFANDGIGDAGGVQAYIESTMVGLIERGHDVGFLHYDRYDNRQGTNYLARVCRFEVSKLGIDLALEKVKAWKPDVCFSHNMQLLGLERRLLNEWPVVKLMHGYFGTCVGGLKTLSFPTPTPCDRRFGPQCLALYLPRRCGQASVGTMLNHYSWAKRQKEMFDDYAAVMVASDHMKREYLRNGVKEEKLHVNPLFPANAQTEAGDVGATFSDGRTVLFMGRMTKLKGGQLLIRAVSKAEKELGSDINLLMVGDGPQRAAWEALAKSLKLSATFTGWLRGEKQREALRKASLLAVPSVWPEPFGLVGLEAAQAGVPAVAFDVGGISDWLRDGINGYLVRSFPPSAQALAQGLVKCLGHPEKLRELSARAREVAAEMSAARHLDRLEKILEHASGAYGACHAAMEDQVVLA
jgi:glycosyltransferase involved in cell wall biosynthesis